MTTLPSSTFKIISIDGNIGSGKSTLVENLKIYAESNPEGFHGRPILFLKEPVEEWETIKDENGTTMLQKFYENQERYSFPFQMMAYISRLSMLKRTIKENPTAIIITERSLYTDKFVFAKMLYESNKIESVNYQIYLKWFDVFAQECPVHQVIYVKTDPVICHSRIVKRSRVGENAIPLEYLHECHKYHETMIGDFLPSENICPTQNQLVLNGDVDIFENKDQLKEWINDIMKFIL